MYASENHKKGFPNGNMCPVRRLAFPSPRGRRGDPEYSNQSDPGKVLGLLLRVPAGSQVMHQGSASQASLSCIPLPDGDQPKKEKGIHPRAEGKDG